MVTRSGHANANADPNGIRTETDIAPSLPLAFSRGKIRIICYPHPGENKHEELLTLVKKRKLSWFGHLNVSRFSGLGKTILQGTVQG